VRTAASGWKLPAQTARPSTGLGRSFVTTAVRAWRVNSPRPEDLRYLAINILIALVNSEYHLASEEPKRVTEMVEDLMNLISESGALFLA